MILFEDVTGRCRQRLRSVPSRNSALKSRTLFEPKFFRDFNAKADLSHVAASMPIRFLSAQALENSGILVQQMMSNNRIPGIECSPTPISISHHLTGPHCPVPISHLRLARGS
jgi:hypothetical protein